ncbi:alpha/beta fold hydrolase [Roseovarius rhodophyticola]|uniref:Alpha/beta hydrolase n=1 Tax=Roseovarius rhodophyticola TaxID=3080827 RepID=A0ABZ2TKI1_9RHOB|nr:alpha/beta hydrolase [Roseovarius sp. W115]MDV2929923.1 alpha/beta hydrolase [Roseovarius sp. W115]
MIWWVLIGLVALVVFGPFLLDLTRPGMNRATQAFAPGAFADLPKGRVHYQWLGADEGPVAVCVHGLSTPSFVWGPVAAHLGGLGFRVLIFDLYGRGYSDRPGGEQDGAFFNAQLNALLEHQGVEDDITLLGYSMGGAIVARYAAEHPDRLRQLCLIAPAGLGHDLGSIADLIIKYEWFGRWVAYAFFPKILRQGIASEQSTPAAIRDIYDMQTAETRRRGFAHAMWSSLRGVLDEDLEPAHRAIAKAGIPVLAIWGREDDVIPIAGLGKLAEWNRAARHEVIEGAGHSLTYTRVEDVGKALDLLER